MIGTIDKGLAIILALFNWFFGFMCGWGLARTLEYEKSKKSLNTANPEVSKGKQG